MIAPERLASAIGASLVLHAAGAALLAQLPVGWSGAASAERGVHAGVIHATLRAQATKPPAQAVAHARPTASAAEPEKTPAPAGIVPSVYHPAHLLDERPQVRVHVEPVFPPEAPVKSGRVMVHLYIGTDGRIEEVVVADAQPPGVFEQAAAQAFAAAQFTPGKVRGESVKAHLAIEVLFGAPSPASASNGQH